jgi:hypothetical protein
MMSPMSDLLFAREWGSPEGRSPTPLTRKKEITMTKSRHKDAGTDADRRPLVRGSRSLTLALALALTADRWFAVRGR